jgi:hypothetical protein
VFAEDGDRSRSVRIFVVLRVTNRSYARTRSIHSLGFNSRMTGYLSSICQLTSFDLSRVSILRLTKASCFRLSGF